MILALVVAEKNIKIVVVEKYNVTFSIQKKIEESMANNKFKKFMDIMMSDEPKSTDLQKIGISAREHQRFRRLLLGIETNSYNRIMTNAEKELFTADAFRYLVQMVHQKAIATEDFENVISICMQLQDILQIRLTKDNVDDILNYVVFLKTGELDIKMILETIFMGNNNYNKEIN